MDWDSFRTDRKRLGRPFVVAHRGAQTEEPENTLASFGRAIEQGADVLETDLPTSDTKAGLLATPNDTVRDYRNLGNFFLIRDTTGIYAMTAVCTHLGCTVGAPIGTQITCRCHGSQYDLNGGNTLGPAVQPLVHFQVTEASAGGLLVVNTSQTVAASARLT